MNKGSGWAIDLFEGEYVNVSIYGPLSGEGAHILNCLID